MGRYAELVVATAVAGLEGMHRRVWAHQALLPLADIDSPEAIDALSAVLRLVSTTEERRRYARVIIVGSEAPAVDRLVGRVRNAFPKIATSGRLFAAVVPADADALDYATGHARVAEF